MAEDARTKGTVAQNAELAAAVSLDSLADAPFWAINKIFGTKVPAPLHLAADVYDAQTKGLFLDADGNPLDPALVEAATAGAEASGGIIDAAVQTGKDAADHPLALVPAWVWIAGALGLVVVVGYYALAARAVLKGGR